MLRPLFLALLGLTSLFAAENTPARHPNVIVILVDDMGQTDLACYGSRFYETPNVDQLAKDGVRFANGYSACTVCSPTRAALMTGKYPARLHITDWIAGHERPKAKLQIPDWQKFLPFEEITLAEQFKSAGYATASIGKWHLTPGLKEGDEAYYPDKHGFDVNLGGYAKGQPPRYVSPYGIPTLKDGPAGEFLTDREADEAVKFIEANKDKPFFIYLPHYAVHQPIAGKPAVVAKFKDKAEQTADLKQKNATYAALVASVDDALGTIRAALKRLKLDDNTIIVFTTDNGGLLPTTAHSPLPAGQGSAYERLSRVTLTIYMPRVTTSRPAAPSPAATLPPPPPLPHPALFRAGGQVGGDFLGVVRAGEDGDRVGGEDVVEDLAHPLAAVAFDALGTGNQNGGGGQAEGGEIGRDLAGGGGRHAEDDQRVVERVGQPDRGAHVVREKNLREVARVAVAGVDRVDDGGVAADQQDLLEPRGQQDGESGAEGAGAEDGGGGDGLVRHRAFSCVRSGVRCRREGAGD